MALERETEVPASATAKWLQKNGAALAGLAVATVGLLALFGRQVAQGAVGAMPPWWLSVPLWGCVVGLTAVSFARGERAWRLIVAALFAMVTATFLGWFIVGFIVIAGIYLGLQLIG